MKLATNRTVRSKEVTTVLGINFKKKAKTGKHSVEEVSCCHS